MPSWTSSTPKPGALTGHTVTAVPGGALLFGGLAPGKNKKTKTGDVVRGDLYARADQDEGWQPVKMSKGDGAAPAAVYSHAAAVVGAGELALLVFGGANELCWPTQTWLLPLGEASNMQVQLRLRHEALEWAAAPRQECSPCARVGHTLTALPATGDALLFGGFGGKNRGALNDTWVFNYASKAWARKPTTGDQPAVRRRHSAAAYEHSVYVYGGSGADAAPLNDIHALNAHTWVWQKVAVGWTTAMPAPRAGHAAWMEDGVMVVCGGEVLDGVYEGEVADDAYAVAVHGQGGEARWVQLEEGLPKRCNAAAFKHAGALCVHGGKDANGKVAADEFTAPSVPAALLPSPRDASEADASSYSPGPSPPSNTSFPACLPTATPNDSLGHSTSVCSGTPPPHRFADPSHATKPTPPALDLTSPAVPASDDGGSPDSPFSNFARSRIAKASFDRQQAGLAHAPAAPAPAAAADALADLF